MAGFVGCILFTQSVALKMSVSLAVPMQWFMRRSFVGKQTDLSESSQYSASLLTVTHPPEQLFVSPSLLGSADWPPVCKLTLFIY